MRSLVRSLGRLALVLGIASLSACEATPVEPSSPPAPSSPTVTSVTISSTGDILAAGGNATFTATASKSDGTTQVVTAGVWNSDAKSVAVVDGAGGVTAVSPGDATITVDYQGLRGSKRISVRANYQGRWSGNYVVESCTDSGGFASAGACKNLFPPQSGIQYTLEFVLAQSADRVTGQALFGTTPSPMAQGTVQANGSMQTTSVTNATATIAANHTWNLSVAIAGRIEGTMVMVWSDTSAAGSMTVTTTLSNVVQVGSAAVGKIR